MYDEYEDYEEYDNNIDRHRRKRLPALGFGDIGGAGQIIYNLVRFQEYDWDSVEDRDVIIPMCDAGHSFILPNEDSHTGKEILVSLYNLAKKLNDPGETRSFMYEILDWCKQYGNPYGVDELYALITDPAFDSSMNREVEGIGTFQLGRFLYDLGKLYTIASYYFALQGIALGKDDLAYDLNAEGRFFEGLPFFEKYKYFEVEDPAYDGVDLSVAEGNLRREILLLAEYRKNHPVMESDDPSEEIETGEFKQVPYDEYDELYDMLLDIMPSFEIRVRRNPKTKQIVFAAGVESVFDIAWLALARKIADEVPAEKKGSAADRKGAIRVCPYCREAFVQNSNRQITCGKPECNRERTKRNKRRERERKRGL